MSHDPTTPRRGVSSLRQARLDRGWSEAEAAALVRALCRNGQECGMTPGRLRDFELGIRHPGAAHTDALSRLYGRNPATLPPDGTTRLPGQPTDQNSDQNSDQTEE